MTMTNNEYTPTTEQVRHGYADGLAGTSRTRQESCAEFDRWLDTTIRQAKAEALREAAAYLLNRAWPINFFPGVAGSAQELEARASRIEAGE